MMMMAAGTIVLGACKEKKQPDDVITANYTVQRPKAPISMPADSQRVDVKWLGKPYVVKIVRVPVDSLTVTDEIGQKYIDNKIKLDIIRQDGSSFASRTFTKHAFSSYLQEVFRREGVLGSIRFEEVVGQMLKFSVVVGLPDAIDDVFIPLEMTIDSDGGLGIRQTDDMSLRDDTDEGV
jgi:hypothetical protein